MSKHKKPSLDFRNLSKQLLYEPGGKEPLKRFATRIDDLYKDDDDYEKILNGFRATISERQDLLFAQGRHGVLALFQGMDTSGKDGAIKHVMTSLNPLGVEATAFGSPSEDDKHRDFLWRTHNRIPPRGKIGIFNRSYYEEVTAVRVHESYLAAENLPADLSEDKKIWKHRLEDIANFESYLARQGIRVIKFYLHLSKDEQRKRLLERIDNPSKNWKFRAGDLTDRDLWPDFMDAYADCFHRTSTEEAPWYIIPADDKKNARLMVSALFAELMKTLPLDLPPLSRDQKQTLEKLRKTF